MNAAITQSPWLEQLGWTLLHFLWQGALVAAVLAATLAGLRGRAARTRYLVSVAGALAAVLLPLATFLLLPLPQTVGPFSAPPREKPMLPAAPNPLQPAAVSVPAPPFVEAKPTQSPASSPLATLSPTQTRVLPTLRQLYGMLAAKARPSLPWLAAVWTLGVAGLSFRLLAGWTQVQRLRRQGVAPADDHWQARLQILAARLGVRRAVRLLESTLAQVPAVIGSLRPVILLPVGVLAGLSTAQVEMILAHELAHVRRQDYLVNLGLALFETLGFYHPAVWWIARCVRTEREHVCDDLAVSVGGGDRIGYVRALATLEEMRGPAGQFALAASGGGRGQLLARVRRLLGITAERRPRTGRATWWLAGLIALLSALAVTLGGVQRPALAQEVPSKKQPPAGEWLRGRVVDENGQPVAGALVYDDASHDKTIEYPPGPVVTDADGGFRVPKQRYPGQWRFVGARLGDTSVGWLDIGAGRQPAAFGSDDVLTRPLVLRSRRFALRGTCVDEAGQPVAGATVAVTSLPAEGSDRFNWQPSYPEETIYQFWEALTTRSDTAGHFSLPVPLEQGMSVEIRAPGRQTVEPFQTVKAGVPPVTDLGQVTLKAAGSIAGRIVFQPAGGEPRPLQDAFLQAVNVAESKKADFLGPKEYGNVPFSDAQGRYSIEHLPPGTYTIFLFGLSSEDPSKEPVRMAAVENVVVRAGETTALDLRAVPGKSLRVRAEDPVTHQPARDLAVHFVGPSRPASSGLNMGAALHQGEWTLTVAPGHYRVFLSSGYGPNSPEVASADVDVPADREPDPVLLQVKTEPHLRGKVQDARGKFIPLGSASVMLLETSPTPGRQEAGGQSSNGTFDIPLTRTGHRARLVVDMPGYRAFVSPEFAVVERPEPMAVTLEEAPALTVTGRALDQDGKPMARAYVSGQIVVADGLHYNVRLGNGIPNIELQTDEDGRFETRRFRGGDRFQVFVYGKDGAVSESADRPWTHPQEGDSYRLDMKVRPATRPPTADTPVGPRDLAGHVVDAQGNPIKGVLITANGKYPAPSPVTTDAQGRFRFVDYGEGRHAGLIADLAGYGTRHLMDVSTGRDLEVRLENTTRLRGKFLRPDGAAAGSATITLFANKTTRSPEGIHTSSHGFTLTTDERGEYDIPVEPGEYDVEILADRENLVARHEKFTVPADRATALPEGLQPGLELRIQTVDGVTGRPAPGARFYLRDQGNVAAFGPRPGSERQTDPRGFARWDHLFPGPVFVDVDRDPVFARFWSTDKREHHHDAVRASPHLTRDQGAGGSLYIDVLAGRGDDPVVVQTERGVVVSGRVLDPQSRPVGGVQIDVLMSGPDGTPDGETVYGLTGFPNSTVTAADGTFLGWCIPAGNGGRTYLVADDHLNTPGYTLGNGHSDPFPSAPGDKREVYIHLTTGGWIEGSVVDARGQPLANVPVAAAVLDHLDGYANHIGPKTDAQGHFRIGPLRPTEYEVRARGSDWDWDHPEPSEEKRRVTVPAGETVQTGPLHFDPVGWTAPPAPTPAPASTSTEKSSVGPDATFIVGHVVDAQGKGVPDAEVFNIDDEFDLYGRASTPPTRTDASGAFRLPVPVGRHQLAACHGDESVGWITTTAVSPVITLLPRSAALDGNIRDAAGLPVEGARVQVGTLGDGDTYLGCSLSFCASTARFWNALAATSDARGHFRLPLPERATRSCSVTHPRYVTQHLYNLPADGHFGRVTLARGGSISGHVLLSPENTPFENALVWVSRPRADGEGGDLHGNARAAADGSYLVSGLDPGEYTVTINPRQGGPRAAVGIEHIAVRAGETAAGADLRAVAGRTITVEAVDAATDRPRGDAEVACYGPGEPRSAAANFVAVGSDGRTQFVVVPGTYECCVVSPAGNEGNRRTVKVPADPSVPVPVVRLPVGTDARFQGVVRMRDGSPVPAGTVIDLMRLPGEDRSHFSRRRTQSRHGNELRYTYDDVTPGARVTVVVDAPGCKTWRSQEWTVGTNPPDLRTTLEPAESARLRGQIVDGRGYPFDPMDATNGPAAALVRWRDWLNKSGGTLPERSQPAPAPPATSAGWLGLVIGNEPDGSSLRVFEAVRAGPAHRAGVRTLDFIAAVDGHPVAGKTAAEVAARELAGAVGTPVRLTVWRAHKPDPMEITVVREARPTRTNQDGLEQGTPPESPPASPMPSPAAHGVSSDPVTLPFKLAVTQKAKGAFQGTDAIQIREVTGTAENFQVGGVYRIVGTCRQQTLPRATLYIGNTAEAGPEAITAAAGSSLYKELANGSTEFDCTFRLLRPGILHVTVYNLENPDRSDNVYAGIILGDAILKH